MELEAYNSPHWQIGSVELKRRQEDPAIIESSDGVRKKLFGFDSSEGDREDVFNDCDDLTQCSSSSEYFSQSSMEMSIGATLGERKRGSQLFNSPSQVLGT